LSAGAVEPNGATGRNAAAEPATARRITRRIIDVRNRPPSKKKCILFELKGF